MDLIACRACRKEIAKAAEACPHCGVSHPGWTKAELILSHLPKIGGGFVVLWLAWTCSDAIKEGQLTRRDAPVTAAAVSSACSLSDVTVIKPHASVDDADWIHLSGRVRNDCTRQAVIVLAWSARTRGGVIAFTEDIWVNDGHPVPAGETAVFEGLREWPAVRSIEWTVRVERVDEALS